MFKKILYPVDLAHADFAAGFVSDVEHIADAFGAQIEIMTAVPGLGMAIVASYFPPETEERAMRDMDERLQAFAQQAFSRPVAHSVSQGTHWKRIVDTAKTKNIDLIIMPHCDKGWAENMLLGSCTQKVCERAPCSVLMLRPTGACPA